MGGRAVEGTGLENRQTGDRLVGSNPTPSAKNRLFTTVYAGKHQQDTLWYTPFELHMVQVHEPSAEGFLGVRIRPAQRFCSLSASQPSQGAGEARLESKQLCDSRTRKGVSHERDRKTPPEKSERGFLCIA